MNIKRKCLFTPDTEKGSTSARLRYRIKWGRNVVAFGVGYRVELDRWNAEAQRCVANTTHGKNRTPASVINRAIQKLEEVANETFAHFEVQDLIPSAEDFRIEFNRRTLRDTERKHKHEYSLLEVMDLFVSAESRNAMWTTATTQKFGAMRRHILEYNPILTFQDLTASGLSSFVSYLRDDLKLRNTTITKKLGFLKWFLNWATAEGYNTTLAYKAFNPKLKSAQKTIIFLDWDELMHLYTLDLPTETYRHVRDVFCFCCFTSLRYSDVANLRRSNVRTNHIEITTVKTIDSLRIELNKYSRAILDRYRGEEYDNDLALPVISNQKMNVYLKDICKLAGFDTPTQITYYQANERVDEVRPKYELIGTHAGRRTFICNALMMGIQPEIVMKWTGHSDYTAMKPYIAVADKAKADAMSLFDRR